MFLKSKQFNHAEKSFHSALNMSRSTVITCRERIFFTHFANTLQSFELFASRDDAPREMTTVTGDLQRTLSMITDPAEYELTLLHFMSFHRMATEAFGHWKFHNDKENSEEEKLKLELLKLVSRLKGLKDKEEDDDDNDDDDYKGVHNDINLDSVSKRVDLVIKSKYDFARYMDLLGHPLRNPEVDDMLRGLFSDGEL